MLPLVLIETQKKQLPFIIHKCWSLISPGFCSRLIGPGFLACFKTWYFAEKPYQILGESANAKERWSWCWFELRKHVAFVQHSLASKLPGCECVKLAVVEKNIQFFFRKFMLIYTSMPLLPVPDMRYEDVEKHGPRQFSDLIFSTPFYHSFKWMKLTQVEKNKCHPLRWQLGSCFFDGWNSGSWFWCQLVSTVQSVWCRTLASFAFELRL